MNNNIRALLVVSSFFFATNSYSSIISADLDSLGDGLLIEDTVSELQWADWSEHPGNISVADFFSLSQWAGDGFRLATEDEIVTLFTNAGADSFSYGNYDQAGVGSAANTGAILSLNATTNHQSSNGWADTNGNRWIHAFYDDAGDTGRVSAVRFNSEEVGGGDIDFFVSVDTYSASNVWDLQFSVMAVRDSVSFNQVPEPSIIALFGLGLVGLGFARRRRQA